MSQTTNNCVPGEVSTDIMRTKKSELRLYCDLLMQQVHSVKQSITHKGEGETVAVPDVEVLYAMMSITTGTASHWW